MSFLLCLLLPGWGSAAEDGADDTVSLGVLPYLPAVELHDRFSPLINRLARELGRPVRLVVPSDYASLVDMVGRDVIELAYIGPAPYVDVVERFGEKVMLGRLEVGGSPTFRGVIVVRADSPLQRLDDLVGKRFAFGDANSTMSHLVPRHMLQEAGIPVDRLGAHAFLGSHKNVALAVLMGEFDAGAVKDEILIEYGGLRPLAFTVPVSQQFFIATRRLPQAEAEQVRRLLLALGSNAEGRRMLDRIEPNVTGLVPAGPEDYQDLRRVLSEIDWPNG